MHQRPALVRTDGPASTPSTIGVHGAGDLTPSLPASPTQAGIWFMDGLRPGHPAYALSAAFDLSGPRDVRAPAQSLHDLVGRHDIFRTTFAEIDGELRQVVAPHGTCPLESVDCRAVPSSSRDEQKAETVRRLARRGFDLARGPLVAASLIRWSDVEHTLVLCAHRAAVDHSSLGNVCAQLSALYTARVVPDSADVPAPSLQYSDYAERRRRRLEGEGREELVRFWQRTLEGAVPALDLPLDHVRPPAKSFDGAIEPLELSREQYARLKNVAEREHVLPLAVLLSTVAVLLSRYCRQDDLIVGALTADRDEPDERLVIGPVASPLVVRVDTSDNPTVRELLQRVHGASTLAHAHRDLPFDQVVRMAQPDHDPGTTPFPQVMVNLRGPAAHRLAFSGLATSPVAAHNGAAMFDLSFNLEEAASGLKGHIEYATDLFAAGTVRRTAGHFTRLLAGMLADADQRISDLGMLTDAERKQVLVEWNATERPYPADQGLHRLFEMQAARTPDATAVIFGPERMSYETLNRRANRLAAHLGALGVTNGALVGVCMERSADLIVSLLAVLKAGAAYVPLDPAYPADRLGFILEDTAAPVVLTSRQARQALPAHQAHEVLVAELPDTDDVPFVLEREPAAEDLAYVIYTSGSTGRPKGVELQHRAAVSFVYWGRRLFSDHELAGVLAATSVCFDLSIFEIFVPLSWGGTVILAENALELAALGAAGEVTLVNTVPSVLAELLRQGPLPQSVVTINLAGEPLPDALVEEIYARTSATRVYNLYGPTEFTTYATGMVVPRGVRVTIGRPIDNTKVYIVDRHRTPMPIGVAGELCLAGAGLAKGYHGRPTLTDERFVPNPFSSVPGARMYRTGDLCRWRADGQIEYLGRLDHQVKLRGFRIELGEIAAVLRQDPHVADAVAMVSEDDAGEKRLVAYVVAAGGDETTPADDRTRAVLESARAKLPEYMVPAMLIWLPVFPLTPNGKLDRRALPAPQWTSSTASDATLAASVAEKKLADIWRAILNLDRRIGIDENFFALGGHSLLAARMVYQIQKEFDQILPLATLFQGPTIRHLARMLEGQSAEGHGGQPKFSSLVAIQPKGTKPPLFAVHGVGGNVLTYRHLAKHLGDDQPLYGLQARGVDGTETPHLRVEDMAADYVTEIRRVQPAGPYYIGGYSFGCSAALEIAQQLRQQGETVALLALLEGDLWRAAELVPLSERIPGTIRFQLSRLRLHIVDFAHLKPREMLNYFRSKGRTLRRRFRSAVWRSRVRRQEGLADVPDVPGHLRKVDEYSHLALRQYKPQHYDSAAVLFRSDANRRVRPALPHWGWGAVVRGEFNVVEVPGDHLSVVEEPHVQVLARELTAALERARRRVEQAAATRPS